jgi:hypothetical protein
MLDFFNNTKMLNFSSEIRTLLICLKFLIQEQFRNNREEKYFKSIAGLQKRWTALPGGFSKARKKQKRKKENFLKSLDIL